MQNNKSILITGASGFIGFHLTNEALLRGYDVYAAVRKSTDTSALKEKGVILVDMDLHNPPDIFQKFNALPPIDYIIHNAGIIRAVNNEEFKEINFHNTRRLLEGMMRTSKSPSKFLYISSLAALGPCTGNHRSPVGLITTPAPLTAYGRSKLMTENLIEHNDWLPYIILRPTAVYGPGDKDLFRIIKFIKRGIDLQIGKGSQVLTFIYVKDLAKLTFTALESEIENKAYCVSDGNPYNEYDFGKTVAKYLSKRTVHISVPVALASAIAAISEKISVISGNPPLINIDKVNELSAKSWCCDTRPLLEDFFFRAEYDLDKGMNETIEWYKRNKWL